MHQLVTKVEDFRNADQRTSFAIANFDSIKALHGEFYSNRMEEAHKIFVQTLPKIERMSLELEDHKYTSTERGTVNGVPMFAEPKKVTSFPHSVLHILFIWQNVIMMRLDTVNGSIKFTGLNLTQTSPKVGNKKKPKNNPNYIENGGTSFGQAHEYCLKEGVRLEETSFFFTYMDHLPEHNFMVVDIPFDVNWAPRELEETSDWTGIDSETFFNSTAIDPYFHQLGHYSAGGLTYYHGNNYMTRLSAYHSIQLRAIKFYEDDHVLRGVYYDDKRFFFYFNKKDQFARKVESHYACNIVGEKHMLKLGANACREPHDTWQTDDERVEEDMSF